MFFAQYSGAIAEYELFFFFWQELHTPRSNRSVDSGLPHDDITPRSDSLSTASSASPPDQQHPHQPPHPQQALVVHHAQQISREMQQQHRKSTSMDDINITNGLGVGAGGRPGMMPGQPGSTWKSYSLQRGTVAPGADQAIYASTGTNPDGTVVIRRPSNKAVTQTAAVTDDEDPYGRCMNMKLTSFNGDSSNGGQARDPRIIDLTLQNSPNSSQTNLTCSPPPRQGSPLQYTAVQQQTQQANFNTLPAQVRRYHLLLNVFSACGGIRTGIRKPVLTGHPGKQ